MDHVRSCERCNIQVTFYEFIQSFGEEILSRKTTVEKLEEIWGDDTITFYCNDCIDYSRLDVDLCMREEPKSLLRDLKKDQVKLS